MKNKSNSFSFLIVIYSAFLALVVAPLFGGAVALSVSAGRRPYIIGWLMMILLFILSFIVNYLVLTYLFTYVNKLTKSIKQVANGDFTIRLKSNKLNPLNSTFSDFNQMVAELDSTKVMKEDFISQFSHEFKTPITSINGFANLLLTKNLDQEKQVEYLHIIAEESKRLTQLSKQIMNLTNLENKKIITNQRIVKIDEELRKSIISLLPEIEAKKLNYNLNLAKIIYYTNSELLKEVWINLLNNSIKFTPENGTIYVACKESRKQIRVVIGNNGPEISETDRKKIFDKFYQGDTDAKSQGLGLGLAIVSKIIKLMNGKINIMSDYQNNKGTFFEIVLPK